MTRYKAALIHFSLSVIVVSLVGAVIWFVWYPGAMFRLAGGLNLVLLIAMVDITLGPLLTLVVYKQGKKSLRFDLTCIATLQILALLYGLSVTAQSRPAYIVFVKDHFRLVRANELFESLDKPGVTLPSQEAPWIGPQVVAAAVPDTVSPLGQKLLASSIYGADAEMYPSLYRTFEGEFKSLALSKSLPIDQLVAKNRSRGSDIEGLRRRCPHARYLALTGKQRDGSVVISQVDGTICEITDIDGWSEGR